MKLLRVRSPKSRCLRPICFSESLKSDLHENKNDGEITELCDLFEVAAHLHENWRASMSNMSESSHASADVEVVSQAYFSFLRTASDWLARGTTEKNSPLIYNGGFLMLLSTVLFLIVCASINREICNASKRTQELKSFKPENWIALAGVCGHAVSFNSSSLVEEEQFTLHFLVVTLWCSLFRKVCQRRCSHQWASCQSYKSLWSLLPGVRRSMEGNSFHGDAKESIGCERAVLAQAMAITLVLITARLLRGWHRSGVNWAHLPDLAKWLEKGDHTALLALQMVSIVVITIICCWLVLEHTPQILLQRAVAGAFCLAACLIVWYNLRTRGVMAGLVDHFSIRIAQLVYSLLGSTALAVLLLTPLFFGSSVTKELSVTTTFSKRESARAHQMHLNLIGKVLISCWCLLQLLLQQPVNAGPVVLLLVQVISCLVFFKLSGSSLDFWLKVLMLYWMGSSGHFGMGNTNTLATVDVAGAYIGLSQHSILWSGLLAFMITYAAPLLYMFAVLSMISLADFDTNDKDIDKGKEGWLLEAVALACSIPLLLSSVVLVSFTFVMLLMQGHLFIWSVFSPKYIYVCFTVLSTYWGVIFNTLVSLYTYAIVSKFSR